MAYVWMFRSSSGPAPLKLTDFACQLAGVHSKFPRRPQYISYPSDITMAKIFAFLAKNWPYCICKGNILVFKTSHFPTKAAIESFWRVPCWATKWKIFVKTWSFDLFDPKTRKLKAPPTGFTRSPTSSWSKEAATIISVEVAKAWCHG